jgi:hypothetical protein
VDPKTKERSKTHAAEKLKRSQKQRDDAVLNRTYVCDPCGKVKSTQQDLNHHYTTAEHIQTMKDLEFGISEGEAEKREKKRRLKDNSARSKEKAIKGSSSGSNLYIHSFTDPAWSLT